MPIKIGELSLYTTGEIAEKLGLRNQTVRAYIREGKIKGQKAGTRWYITEDALREFFESYLNDEKEPRNLEEIFSILTSLVNEAKAALSREPYSDYAPKIQKFVEIFEE